MAQTNPTSDNINDSLQLPYRVKSQNASPHQTEQQRLISQVENSSVYCPLQRDQELFKWLDRQRKSRSSSCIDTLSIADLNKACQFYRMTKTKGRGILQAIPMPVTSTVVKSGSPNHLFSSILTALGHPLASGSHLRDLRLRTHSTLNTYGVKLLIVCNAHDLSYKALNELVIMVDNLKLAVILTGSLYLFERMSASDYMKKRYAHVYNTFLGRYEFLPFFREEMDLLLDSWEEQVLGPLGRKLNLAQVPDLCNRLYERCRGQAEPLYVWLRQIAIDLIENDDMELDVSSLDKIVGRLPPIGALEMKA